ncbi:hypothetical protein [Nostoc sp. FACHB-145]|uniref:hypothetical protein n=1 Tax=Nostoc sp. FACHB-145 TaxID=2692836 RepID=UPI001F55007A|nr:hypothetical protein [Nostoc sp. FACHB-145]
MNYSPEYLSYIRSSQWKNKSINCQKLTNFHCIIFPWYKSSHAHHLTYDNLKFELPVKDIVPLSKTAHSLVHWGIFWKTPLRVGVNWLLRLLMVISVITWAIIQTANRRY